jgi:hypothetical protein
MRNRILMVFIISFMLAFFITGGTDESTGSWENLMNPREKARWESANSLDRRMRVYQDITERVQKELRKAVTAAAYEAVPELLDQWIILLEKSCEDIETSPENGRKRRIIQYEISLRKAIKTVEGLKIMSDAELHDAFDIWAVRAETIRGRIMKVVFPQ